jgi:hypothetical protein
MSKPLCFCWEVLAREVAVDRRWAYAEVEIGSLHVVPAVPKGLAAGGVHGGVCALVFRVALGGERVAVVHDVRAAVRLGQVVQRLVVDVFRICLEAVGVVDGLLRVVRGLDQRIDAAVGYAEVVKVELVGPFQLSAADLVVLALEVCKSLGGIEAAPAVCPDAELVIGRGIFREAKRSAELQEELEGLTEKSKSA